MGSTVDRFIQRFQSTEPHSYPLSLRLSQGWRRTETLLLSAVIPEASLQAVGLNSKTPGVPDSPGQRY